MVYYFLTEKILSKAISLYFVILILLSLFLCCVDVVWYSSLYCSFVDSPPDDGQYCSPAIVTLVSETLIIVAYLTVLLKTPLIFYFSNLVANCFSSQYVPEHLFSSKSA